IKSNEDQKILTEDESNEEENEKDVIETEPVSVKAEPLPENEPKDKFAILYHKYAKKNYKTFDIHYVEDVLHTGDREIKIDMVKKWFDIERHVDSETMKYAKMITEGTLVATNGVMLIVTYDSYAMCNRLMTAEIRKKLVDVLEDYFGRKIMFLAIPNDLWDSIQHEFIKKFKQKKSADEFVKLTPINHPRLVEIPQEDESFEDIESDSLKEAKDIFGDIVKVKRGE
ncbi:MAG: hypothetical protein ACNA7U_01085, partial [Candidatus Izemoplasmataceae bacterium]